MSEKKLISTTSKCNLITLKSFLSYKVKYFIDYHVGCLCQKLLSYLELKRLPQNLSFEAQFKNFFILQKSYVSFSSFCIFNHPIIHQVCDVMMSIST